LKVLLEDTVYRNFDVRLSDSGLFYLTRNLRSELGPSDRLSIVSRIGTSDQMFE